MEQDGLSSDKKKKKKRKGVSLIVLTTLIIVAVAILVLQSPQTRFSMSNFFNNEESFSSHSSFKNGLITVKNGTLSTDVPDREGTTACVSKKNWYDICADPENFTATGYYPNATGTGFYQVGTMEYYITPYFKLTKREYNLSQMNFTIITEHPELYEIVDVYIEPLVNVSTLITNYTNMTGDLWANQTLYPPFNVTTPTREWVNITDADNNTVEGWNETGFEEITHYYFWRNTTQKVKEELTTWDLDSGVKLVFEMTVPYPSNDVFDIQGCFDHNGVWFCELLPAPAFDTSSQTDWNQGTYNHTLANTTGQLELYHDANSEIDNTGFNMTGNVLYLKNNNDSAFGENDTLMYDHSGNGNNGTCTGTACPNFTSNGKVNGAFDFDGSNDIISIPDSTDFNGTTMSWSQWIKIPSTSGTQYTFSMKGDYSGDWSWSFQTFQDDLRFFVSTGSDAGNNLADTTTNVLSANTWHHVVAVYNGSGTTNADKFKVWVDGNETTLTFSGTIPSTIYDSGQVLRIGEFEGLGRYFDGLIDETTIWNRVLSDTEIQTIYNTTKKDFPQTGIYESEIIDAGSAQQWKNISVKGQFGELQHQQEAEEMDLTNLALLLHFNNDSRYGEQDYDNGTAFLYNFAGNNTWDLDCDEDCPTLVDSMQPGLGKAYIFNDSNDNFDLGNNDIACGNDGLFMSAWSKMDSWGTDMRMYSQQSGGAEASHVIMFGHTNGGTPRLRVRLDTAGGSTVTQISSNINIPTDEWFHMAFNYDGSEIDIYLNGVETAYSATASPSGTVDCDSSVKTRIGSAAHNRGNTWDGVIDELIVFNRSLSLTEIQQIYERGLTHVNTSVRSCNDSACSGESWTALTQPTYYPDNLTEAITPNNTYFQYKLDFETTNRSITPYVNNVTINSISAGADATAPTHSTITVNTTVAGEAALFSVLLEDNVAVDGYIFGTNNTGTWTNDTFTSTTAWANVTKILNSTVGNIVGYRWWYNDTAGNSNETGLQLLTTTAEAANCWGDITGGIYVPEGCTYYIPGGTNTYIT